MSEDRDNRFHAFKRTWATTQRARDLRQNTSKTELKLWPHLRNKNLGYSFRRQHPIGPYFADYYCAALKLAIEVDGDWHAPQKDAARDAFFASKGILTHRIHISDIDENLDGVIEALTLVIAERKLELRLD
ncbi:MAG: DNA methylase [Sandaracinus sp.]|nr:DNA methylase [Sandaracinus sp.]